MAGRTERGRPPGVAHLSPLTSTESETVLDARLPAEFGDLEPFAAVWCLPSEGERWARRMTTSIDDMRLFYDAVFPRMEAILAFCDEFPLDALPEKTEHLLQLALSFVMVSFPVEVWNQARIPDIGVANLLRVVDPGFTSP
jgi:hypothetical protein